MNRRRVRVGQAAGFVGAIGLHAALGLLFVTSLDRSPSLLIPTQDNAPGLLVGLVSSASVGASPLVSPPSLFKTFPVQADPFMSSSPQTAPSTSLLAEMDQGAAAPVPGKSTASTGSAHPTGAVGPKAGLTDDLNPWAHAGMIGADPSKARELWLAVKRCWRGSPADPTEIRVRLDASGAVLSMSWVGNGEAGARLVAQSLANAITACAPYRGVVAREGAYLVSGPLA